MFEASAIRPLSDFVRNTRSHIEQLKTTGQPELLTVNGEAAVVVQDAASYEEMARLAEEAKQDTRLREALRYFREGGPGLSFDEVFSRLETRPR